MTDGDRFIPMRSAMDFDQGHFELVKDRENIRSSGNVVLSPSKTASADASSKILAFKSKAPAPREGYQNQLKVLYTQQKAAAPVQRVRQIRQNPEKTLDAPEMGDDYYLNLLDWSAENILAIALGKVVYLWNATNSQIHKLVELDGQDSITSVSWIQDGAYLAVGTDSRDVKIWDYQAGKQLRNLRGHMGRVNALAWNANNVVLSSGSSDCKIFNHDVRIADHIVGSLENHTQQVCGLKWSVDGSQLASGGNDNKLNIWDLGASQPRFTMTQHQSAVKAVAWAPFQPNLLATGAGTADRTIKLWDTTTGACLNSLDTGSQVCALQWSKNHKELISSHGYAQNQLVVWKYPNMVRMAELQSHTARVLHMAQSPDGTTIASAGADEKLCFWRINDGPEKKTTPSGLAALAGKKMDMSSSSHKINNKSLR